MTQEITIQPVPNQSLSTRIDGNMYAITILMRRDAFYITVIINGETVERNRALLSYAPLNGNLMLIDTRGTSDPALQELGQRFILTYWPEE